MISPPTIYDSVVTFSQKIWDRFSIERTQKEMPEIDLGSLDELEDPISESQVVSVIYNNKTFEYDYFSPNVETVYGYTDEELLTGGLKFAMSLVDPEHGAIYNRYIIPNMFKYTMMGILGGNVEDYRFSYTFKVSRKDGSCFWALHHMKALETNALGIPLLTKVLVSDVSMFKWDNTIDYMVYQKDKEGAFAPIFSKSYSIDSKSTVLTKRELEILLLLGQGKTSAEIAKTLQISIHTVNNHRKSMLIKNDGQNTIDLMKKAALRDRIDASMAQVHPGFF